MQARTILLFLAAFGIAAATFALLGGQGCGSGGGPSGVRKGGSGTGRGANGPTASQRAAAENWLIRDCTVGEAQWINDSLRSAGAALEGLFLAAFENGPDSTLQDSVATMGSNLFVRVKAAIDTSRPADFPAAGSFQTSSDSAAFVGRHLGAFIDGYRSRALVGLGVIATPSALARLDTVVADTGSPFSEDALAIRTEVTSNGFFRIK